MGFYLLLCIMWAAALWNFQHFFIHITDCCCFAGIRVLWGRMAGLEASLQARFICGPSLHRAGTDV